MTEPENIFQESHRDVAQLGRLLNQEDGMEARPARSGCGLPPGYVDSALRIHCPKCAALPGLECWGARQAHPGGFVHHERREQWADTARSARVRAASEVRA